MKTYEDTSINYENNFVTYDGSDIQVPDTDVRGKPKGIQVKEKILFKPIIRK